MTPDFGPEDFAAALDVSRETLARLKEFAVLLERWNAQHNLVSKNALQDLWRRHMLDSAQLAQFIPENARSLVDLGSGAGFPGLVLAAICKDRIEATVLYEATAKKCQFLAEAMRLLDIKADIRNARIEEAKPEVFDVLTARACAPLSKLLSYAQNFQGKNTISLFLKGQNLGSELTGAHKFWRVSAQTHRSLSDPSGAVLEVRHFERLRKQHLP